MAATASFLKNDLSCHLCRDIFTEPVVLKCSHCFCRICLQHHWEEKSSRECPICRRKASMDPAPNLALRNVVESFLQQQAKSEAAEKSEARCSVHGEKLRLFCEDDQEPVCVVCQTSRKHKNHQLCPVEEAAQDRKVELKTALIPIKEKLKRFTKVKQECEKTAEHIRSQAQHTERQVKAKFERFHQFLRDEEETRLAAVREEEEQKSQMMKEKIENLKTHISTLSEKITAIERAMNTENISFLRNYDNFQKAPVTLDPNTAAPWLCLSDDLTSVRDTGHKQQLPDNPERFDRSVSVLGSEGFTSGKHSWEVEVGNKPEWDVGVATESINRKVVIPYDPVRGLWVVTLRRGGEYTASGIPLTLKRKPQRIRVQVDYDEGEVSFYDPSDKSHIYTFKDTFTERLFPYLSPCHIDDGVNTGALQVCPVKVSVRADLYFSRMRPRDHVNLRRKGHLGAQFV